MPQRALIFVGACLLSISQPSWAAVELWAESSRMPMRSVQSGGEVSTLLSGALKFSRKVYNATNFTTDAYATFNPGVLLKGPSTPQELLNLCDSLVLEGKRDVGKGRVTANLKLTVPTRKLDLIARAENQKGKKLTVKMDSKSPRKINSVELYSPLTINEKKYGLTVAEKLGNLDTEVRLEGPLRNNTRGLLSVILKAGKGKPKKGWFGHEELSNFDRVDASMKVAFTVNEGRDTLTPTLFLKKRPSYEWKRKLDNGEVKTTLKDGLLGVDFADAAKSGGKWHARFKMPLQNARASTVEFRREITF
ncbi:unnamed protein product [Vitrella brassicaformis CCMP3155]|uniref:Lipid/polyisoprenoid-binding YceI-like domain-containing protein n=1 Tax=Vitrella brassicaformis (strain CCMP3155) TaxID=1169540 RepID=A0A0G4GHC0_VITBC|nr:unnamed protein product [Vitrella brassicaformis CCMP3155]|eukprot:CEM28876.1 unnamed protein product [Vitrella brassicaformis CCMP3155]